MRFIWKERASWRPILEGTRGSRVTKKRLQSALQAAYTEVLVFHGARPTNIESYYEHGLHVADHLALNAIAKQIFISQEFPEIKEETFQNAVGGLSGIETGKLYACLDDRELLEHCGHYLIYGSEHICAIAAQLSRNGRDYRQVLKRFGKPTIFKIALPLKTVSPSDFAEFVDLVHESLPRVRSGRHPPLANFTFMLTDDVSGNFLCGHEHPALIRDPLLQGQPYHVAEG